MEWPPVKTTSAAPINAVSFAVVAVVRWQLPIPRTADVVVSPEDEQPASASWRDLVRPLAGPFILDSTPSIVGGGDLGSEARGGALLLDVADEDRFAREQGFEGFFSGFGAHRIDDARALLLEGFGDVPGDAFAIGDTLDEESFAGELEEIGHRKIR